MRHPFYRLAIVLGALALLAAIPATASAVGPATTWVGAGGGGDGTSWNDGMNWDNGAPVSGTAAVISTGDAVSIPGGISGAADSVTIENGSSLEISGTGSLTLDAGGSVSSVGGNAALHLDSGSAIGSSGAWSINSVVTDSAGTSFSGDATFTNATFDIAAGTTVAGGTSLVIDSTATVTGHAGSELRVASVTNNGNIIADGGTFLIADGGGGKSLTNFSTGSDTLTDGTYTTMNSASLRFAQTGNLTNLANAHVILDDDSTIDQMGGGQFAINIASVDADSSVTINGTDNAGFETDGQNDGSVTIGAGGSSWVWGGGSFTNTGTFTVNGDFNTNDSFDNNGGSVSIGGAGVIHGSTGAYSQSSGTWTIASGGQVQRALTISGGTLIGDGLVTSDLAVGTGMSTVDVYIGADNQPDTMGHLETEGLLTIGSNAIVHVGVGGTGVGEHDLLESSNDDVNIDGQLAVTTTAAYDAAFNYGDWAHVIEASQSLNGTWASTTVPTLMGEGQYFVRTNPDNVSIDSWEENAPSAIANIVISPTHNGQQVNVPTSEGDIQIDWDNSTDSGSGVAGYRMVMDHNAHYDPTSGDYLGDHYYADILGNGTWYLHVRAEDNLGNQGPASDFGPIIIDKTNPTAVIATKPAAKTASTSAAFTFTSNEDPDVNYQCAIDGGAWADCGGSSKTYTGLAKGRTHTFKLKAEDLAHNFSTEQSYTWTIYAAPAKPTKPHFVFKKNGVALLVWTKAASPATAPVSNYVVVYGSKTFKPTGSSVKVTGQKSGRTYKFTIKSVGPGGSSAVTTVKKRRP